MKKLLKKEVYEFREQYMGPTSVTQQPQNAQKKKARRSRRVPFHPYPNPAIVYDMIFQLIIF